MTSASTSEPQKRSFNRPLLLPSHQRPWWRKSVKCHKSRNREQAQDKSIISNFIGENSGK